MTKHPRENTNETLLQAIGAYVAKAPLADRELASRELSRFSRWVGTDTPIAQITPEQVFLYQEQFSASKADLNRRLGPVKEFLSNLKTKKVTSLNLGASVRLRRPPVRRRVGVTTEAPPALLVTEQGYAALSEELKELEERVRPEVTEQLRSAAADKDFSENAPYSAAKHRLSEVRTRINSIHQTLAAASIYVGRSTETVDLGTVVTLSSLTEGVQSVYTIVSVGERRAQDTSISIQSPMGRALMERRVGEVVEVQTPTGTHRYRIEGIERR